MLHGPTIERKIARNLPHMQEAAPALYVALLELLQETPYVSGPEGCECGPNGTGYDENDQPCIHIKAWKACYDATPKG